MRNPSDQNVYIKKKNYFMSSEENNVHQAAQYSHTQQPVQIFSHTKSKFVCAGPHSVPHTRHTIKIRHCHFLGCKPCHLNTVNKVQSKTDAVMTFQINSLPPNIPEE
jgi:hypothetical protein